MNAYWKLAITLVWTLAVFFCGYRLHTIVDEANSAASLERSVKNGNDASNSLEKSLANERLQFQDYDQQWSLTHAKNDPATDCKLPPGGIGVLKNATRMHRPTG
jgi:hypothetical protein